LIVRLSRGLVSYMKKLILLLTLLCSLFSMKSFALELKTGDILLQPLHCWSCNLIEAQENSEYSHVGIVIKVGKEIMVAEAYGKVKLVSLEKFLSKTERAKRVKVRRLDSHFYNFEVFQETIKNQFLSFEGNAYDSQFLWDNHIDGDESLYCSELVYKVLTPVVRFYNLSPKIMHFDVNPELWDRFFQGNTPRGKLGISPEDFNLSTDFYTVGEL